MCCFLRYDPDFVVGFETEHNSLGYLVERAAVLNKKDFAARLSRVTPRGQYKQPQQQPQQQQKQQQQQQQEQKQEQEEQNERDGDDKEVLREMKHKRLFLMLRKKGRKERKGVSLGARQGSRSGAGRTSRAQLVACAQGILLRCIFCCVFNCSFVQSEIALSNYSFAACVFHLLHRRAPVFSGALLSEWWNQRANKWRVVRHICNYAQDVLAMLSSMKIVERTSQLAKVFGIDFSSVLTRGSQYRVESMLLRMTKVGKEKEGKIVVLTQIRLTTLFCCLLLASK
jgi:hypothetical protein